MSTISQLGDRMLGAMLPKARAAACAHASGWCSGVVNQGGGLSYKICQVGNQCVEYDYTPSETYTYVIRTCC